MSLPRVCAGGGGGARRNCAGALLLALVLLLPAASLRAQDTGDPFSATVKVDATAKNAVAARRRARLDGQRRALQQVVERLSGLPDAKLPRLDDNAVTDMVQSFEVAHERMSPVRYLADYTFHFYPDKVRRLMRNSGIAEAAPGSAPPAPAGVSSGAPIIVLPVYTDAGRTVLWDDPNAWREAWAHRPTGSEPTPLLLPLGDAGDVTTIDAQRAQAGNPQALAAIARRNDADEVVVAAATGRRQQGRLAGVAVSIKAYRAGQLVNSESKAIDADPGESADALLQRAAAATASMIEAGGPASASVAPTAPQQSLAAIVPIASLADWLETRRRLDSVMAIHHVALLSLNRHEAEVEIDYIGSPDQLRAGLARADLRLDGGDPTWRVERIGATGLR